MNFFVQLHLFYNLVVSKHDSIQGPDLYLEDA